MSSIQQEIEKCFFIFLLTLILSKVLINNTKLYLFFRTVRINHTKIISH